MTDETIPVTQSTQPATVTPALPTAPAIPAAPAKTTLQSLHAGLNALLAEVEGFEHGLKHKLATSLGELIHDVKEHL